MTSTVERFARAAIPLDSAELPGVVAETARPHRVAALGESHHFVHETYELRSSMLAVLGTAGFRHLGVEISRTDGAMLDRYLESGDVELLQEVGTFGFRHPDDRPYTTGILAAEPSTYPSGLMRAEYRRLLDRLRQRSPSRGRWSMFGFDIDYHPGLAAGRLSTVTDARERSRLEASLDVSRRYDTAVRRATSYEALAEPMAWREDVMREQVLDELARRPADEGMVLAGHNFHISPGSGRIEQGGGVGPGGGLVPPLGAQLAQRGITMSCMWMLHDHGSDSGPPPGDGVVRPVQGSLNAALAAAGSRFALPTRAVPELSEPWMIATMYGATIRAIPAASCDLILFVAATTPMLS
jgi:erythromycin esterase-like protein